MVLKARILLCLIALTLWTACSDDATSKYSNRAPVRAQFRVIEYDEVLHVMGNPGEFASIRRQLEKETGVTTIHMVSSTSDTYYKFLAISQGFEFGLGGLIVGTMQGTWDYPYVCYDLACPVCDRADRRLTLEEGLAKCAHCGAWFNLNDRGNLYKNPTNQTSDSFRKRLYEYQIKYQYGGEYVILSN